jgi:two-component system phosphate regulon sensor histidine kinase PhoR
LQEQEPVEGEIILLEGDRRFLQAKGSALRGVEGDTIGAVIVLDDMTNLKRLENVRREFVANVSHELKTPVTSIKGFVETLQEGAIKKPEEAERFLDIISRQADRLNSIIEDLLLLSRIEQSGEKKEVEFIEAGLKSALESAIETCSGKASEKNISIDLNCEDTLTARINPALLEQAVVNLIDNAIKASDEGSSIKVGASQKDEQVIIEVIDRGVGIEKEHLPRLFERFYRIDKARSRQLGGTGLGLAIVKHIAQAHGGGVDVESSPGEGSRFSIFLF